VSVRYTETLPTVAVLSLLGVDSGIVLRNDKLNYLS
jgi:hypothetical protein